MIVYEQNPPRLSWDGVAIVSEPLYAGKGLGKNNPKFERVPRVGPLPAGLYKITHWVDQHPTKGPIVAFLEPVDHDCLGRSAFRIHGDSISDPGNASLGCIVAPRSVREALRKTGDTELLVV